MFDVDIKNKTYKKGNVVALKDVKFKLPSIGLVYLIGESGSSKSTLLRCLAALDDSYEGNIIYNSKRLKDYFISDLHLFEFSLCLQDDELDNYLSVIDNVMIGLELYNYSYARKKKKALKVLEEVGLLGIKDKKVSLLSGGERKRVSLARALAKEYNVLFLDEPLGPLHFEMRKKMMDLFEKIAKTKLVIIIAHNVKEIGEDKNIIKLKDGRIVENNLVINDEKIGEKSNVNRKKYSFSSILINVLKLFKKRMKHFLFSSFSTSLALISIGLINLISSCVNSSLKTYLSGSLEKNSLMIKEKETKIYRSFDEAAPYQTLKRIENKYQRYVKGIGTYYDMNFEDMFKDQNDVYLKNGLDKYFFKDIGVRNFIEFTYYQELDENSKFEYVELGYQDICLSLSPFSYQALQEYLKTSSSLQEYITSKPLYLIVELSNKTYSYHAESMFKIAEIIMANKTEIIHTKEDFNEYFYDDELSFLSSPIKMNYEYPWTSFKSYFLYCKEDDMRELLNKLYHDKEFVGFSYKVLKEELKLFYSEKRKGTKGRLEVKKAKKSQIDLYKVDEILSTYKDQFKDYYYSNNFYYYSEQGMYSFFLKSIYVSSKKEKINELVDYNYKADVSLNGFMGATIVSKDDIVSSSMVSSSLNEGICFKSIDNKTLLKGIIPRNYNEVVISSSLGEKLFKNPFYIGKDIYLTCLKDVEYINEGYKNIFKDGTLKVVGVIDDDSYCFYHDADFIRALGEDQFELDSETLMNDKVIINFKDDIDNDNVLKELERRYNEYEFSFPSLEVSKGIDEILSYISSILMAFALISSIIAAILMTLVVFLFIKDDYNKIRLLLLEGYTLKDVLRYYSFLSFFIGFIAFFNSSLSLVFMNITFLKGLEEILGIELKSFDVKIYFINFFLALAFSFIPKIISSSKLKKMYKEGLFSK